ncbi:efflux RND transporter periplasmic adaptor subunit [candidate division KSB1 bacterium]|nr:efflux RND transporter periplasmic adaptor subunit [candidate division KSB1 bacterium]
MKKFISFPNSTRGRLLFAGMIAAGLILLFMIVNEDGAGSVVTAEVKSKEFIVYVEITGEIIAHQSRLIKGSRELGRTLKIAKLAPEGSIVKEGDFLLQFDTSDLEKLLKDRQGELDFKNGELIALTAQFETDTVRLIRQLQIAQLTFDKERMKYEMSHLEPLNKRRQMQISMKTSELTFKDKQDDIESQLLQGRNDLQSTRNDIRILENNVAYTNSLIERSTIYAPIPGLVVYMEVSVGIGLGEKEKIKVGSSNSYRRSLIQLPDLSKMLVKAEITEVEYAGIKPGQEADITLDISETVYSGTVSELASLAHTKYIYSPGESPSFETVFDLKIAIHKDEDDLSLKPGMKAVCKIITNKLQNATYIPIRAVFEEAGVTFVYVKDGSSFRKTPVTVGTGNKEDIVITEGLTPGQQVALSDPFADTPDTAQFGSK